MESLFSISDLVDKHIAEQENEKKEINSWHISKIGSCLSGLYLERLGATPEKSLDSRTLRVFEAGKMFESWVIEKIKNTEGYKFEEQVRVEDKNLDVSGYADILVTKPNGEKEVVELKSQHSRAFWYMDKSGKPNRQHQMQLWMYLYLLNIENGKLVYVSKDDLAIAEYVVELNDEELKVETLGRLEILNRAWKEKLPPRPNEDETAWENKYCRFHKQCKHQDNYLN